MKTPDIQTLFAENGGVVKTSQLKANGYYSRKIKQLVDDGIIEPLRRGYYQLLDDNAFSDARIIAALFPDCVICLNSALEYYGYTNRTPSMWHLAADVKTRRDRFKIDYPIVKPYFVNSDKFRIGITDCEIGGVNVKIYDRERTICDCLLHRNKLDPEVYSDAIQAYIKDQEKNEARLIKYACDLKVEKKVREVLGIWL